MSKSAAGGRRPIWHLQSGLGDELLVSPSRRIPVECVCSCFIFWRIFPFDPLAGEQFQVLSQASAWCLKNIDIKGQIYSFPLVFTAWLSTQNYEKSKPIF